MKKINFSLLLILIALIIGSVFLESKNVISKDLAVAPEIEETKKPSQTAICLGPGTLKLYTYICGSEGIMAIEKRDSKSSSPYLTAFPELLDKDILETSKMKKIQEIKELAPDVIFISKSYPHYQIEDLRNKLNIPIVEISYGEKEIFGDATIESLLKIGKIMGKSERAKEITNYLQMTKDDLENRTKDLPIKKNVYIGGGGYSGTESFLSGTSDNEAFELLKIESPIKEQALYRNFKLSKDDLLSLNPDLIFIDLKARPLLQGELENNLSYFKSLKAFRDKKVYVLAPNKEDKTNIELALLNLFYMGKMIHENEFDDIEINEKSKEVFEVMFQKDISNEYFEKYSNIFQSIQV